MSMLPGEWAADADGTVVAGDVVVYRDLIAELLHARPATGDSVGDARLVVLCPSGVGPSEVEPLAADPGRRVLVLGVPEHEALGYYEAGAFYVLPPEFPLEELPVAVDRAACGERDLSKELTTLAFERIRRLGAAGREGPIGKLTVRELEVAKLMAQDFCNKEIASRLFISVSTVKKHTNRILSKLEIPTRRDVASRLR